MQRVKLITKIGGKALPRLGGNGKIPGGIPHMRHHHDDGLNIDGAGEPAKNQWMVYLLVEWVSQRIWCKSYSDHFGKQSTQFYCPPTGGVKSIPPTYRKLATKTVCIQQEEHTWALRTSMKTNHINNKYNDTKHRHAQDAQHMSMHWERVVLRHTFDVGSHAPFGSSSESRHVIHVPCASLLEFTSLHSLLRSVLHHPLPLLPSHAPRAAHWARQPDHHAKTCAPPRTRRVTTPTTSHTSLTVRGGVSRHFQDNDINLLTIDDVPGWMLMRKASLTQERRERLIAALPDEHFAIKASRGNVESASRTTWPGSRRVWNVFWSDYFLSCTSTNTVSPDRYPPAVKERSHWTLVSVSEKENKRRTRVATAVL